jgi:hypothetical protein
VALATRRNELVAALADEVWFAHITPGGRMEQLAKRFSICDRRDALSCVIHLRPLRLALARQRSCVEINSHPARRESRPTDQRQNREGIYFSIVVCSK